MRKAAYTIKAPNWNTTDTNQAETNNHNNVPGAEVKAGSVAIHTATDTSTVRDSLDPTAIQDVISRTTTSGSSGVRVGSVSVVIVGSIVSRGVVVVGGAVVEQRGLAQRLPGLCVV